LNLTAVRGFFVASLAATLMLGSPLEASATVRLAGSAGPDVQLQAIQSALVRQLLTAAALRPHDTALCNRPEIVPLYSTGLIFVPYPCNGWTVLTSYAPPTYAGSAATASYAEFIESSGTPVSAVTNQSLYNVAFPAAPADTTALVYLESIGVSPYPSLTFAGTPPAKYSVDNLIVSTSIAKGATFEILGYRWDPVALQYDAGYASGPITSKYGKLAYFPAFLQNGEVIPQLTRLYFVLYACANAACT